MDWKLLKNVWVSVAIFLSIQILFSILVFASQFLMVFMLAPFILSLGAAPVVASILGSKYAKTFKEIMPKKLRTRIALIYLLFAIPLSVPMLLPFASIAWAFFGFLIVFAAVILSFASLLIYLRLWRSGKMQLMLQ
jgi:hypothetical protein